MTALDKALNLEGWVTVTYAAHLFLVSHSTLYRLAVEGAIESKRVGGRLRKENKVRGGRLYLKVVDLEKLYGSTSWDRRGVE